MIEKVARAICWRQHNWSAEQGYDIWDELGNGDRSGYMDDARTAIEKLREPTNEMRVCVDANWGRRTWAEYNAMIDAALNEPQQ